MVKGEPVRRSNCNAFNQGLTLAGSEEIR